MGRRVFLASKEEIEKLYCVENKTIEEIAKYFGFCVECVRQRMIVLEISRKRKFSGHTGKNPDGIVLAKILNKEDLYRLYCVERKSLECIATLYKVSVTPVSRLLKKYGIPKRILNGSSKIALQGVTKEKLEKLYSVDKLPIKEICKILNVSDSVIDRKRRGFRIPKRKQINPLMGTRTSDSRYNLVFSPDHPNAKKYYVPEHRLVMEKHLGRHLEPKERVHHADCDKTNNKIENLILFKNTSEHQKVHELLKTVAFNADGFMFPRMSPVLGFLI